MHSNHLVSTAEIEIIKAFPGFKPFLPIVWGLDEARAVLGKEMPTAFFIMNFREKAYTMRHHMTNITFMLQMPVPFPYYHVLKLMLLASLLAMSYAICQLMEESKGISFFIFAIVAAIMLGLEEISVAMADPFGDDDTDFDTDEMTRYCYEATVALLRDKNSEGDALRGESLPDDVANPVELIPPRE
eukprot:2519615-Prymnesium_polylepis.1